MVEFPSTYKIISFAFTHLKLLPWHVQMLAKHQIFLKVNPTHAA